MHIVQHSDNQEVAVLATIPMQLFEEHFKGIKDKMQCDGVITW